MVTTEREKKKLNQLILQVKDISWRTEQNILAQNNFHCIEHYIYDLKYWKNLLLFGFYLLSNNPYTEQSC